MAEEKNRQLELYDRYLEANFKDRNLPDFTPDRRDFVKTLGAGILILLALPGEAVAQQDEVGGGRMGRPALPDDFNAFLRIDEEGQVTGFTGKIEMGQGVNTSLAQMLADELDVSLERVTMLMGDTDLCPWDMGTFGSMTTRFFGPPMRAAAAEAKAVLIELGAERLNVPRERLKTEDGQVIDPQSGQRVSYAELAKGQKIVRRLEGKPSLESPSAFTIVGKPVLRVDARQKVTGEAKYSSDIVHPGMLYAALLRPPSHGATLKSVDTSAAEALEGAQVVRDGDLIAVLHASPDGAADGRDLIKAEWKEVQTGLDDSNIFDHLLKSAPAGRTSAQGGDLQAGEAAAEVLAEESYLNSYVAHAAIEPHTAVAKPEGDRILIWASTQTPFRLKDEAAQALGIPADKVRVIPPFVGGGFGGKTFNLQAIEAARLAKLSGKPIQIVWDRREEFFLDTFRPAAVVKIKSGATRDGMMTFWDYGAYACGERGAEQFYTVPNNRTVIYGSGWMGSENKHAFATGAWRAPANNTNTFARESHIDVLASKLKIDPVEFRLKNLKDPRMVGVLEALAKHYGWKPAPSPSGRGLGVSLGIDAGAYVAHIAEVEVDKKTGKIRVKRVVCVQDMGLCINPEGARLQMEGCITMGLGYALSEEIRFKDGRILDTNFDTYKLPRFSWLPEIEAVILDKQNEPAQGGGEPAIISMGSVIANAVFDATGARVLQLPMTPERVKAAL
ncbi:MAG: molybdopterin cofactor-binding domain-containing protein [Acidobacteriota bacterium]